VWYARFDPVAGAWTSTETAKAGARLFASEQDYTGLGALDPRDPDTIFISTEVSPIDDTATNQHEIYKGVTTDQGATWTWTALTANSVHDNLRPIVPAWDAQHTALLWWRGSHTNSIVRDTAVVGLLLADDESVSAFTYVDATAANTTRADGTPLPTTTGGAAGAADGAWHVRTGFANGGTVYAADESGAEDVPVLKTTATGLAAGVYDVSVCFWTDSADWRVAAGLSATDLMVYRSVGAQSVDAGSYANAVLMRESNRTLLQAYVGRVTLAAGQPLEVFVDDAGDASASRAWYDGVAFAPVSARGFGEGCGTPPLTLLPDVTAPPVIGQTARAVVSDAPTPVVLMMVGFSNTLAGMLPLPFDLGAIGMEGCELLQSNEIFGLAMTPLGASSLGFDLALPNSPALVGANVFLQGLAYAPGASPFGFVVSNGLAWWVTDG
jgi:hypothetical protein